MFQLKAAQPEWNKEAPTSPNRETVSATTGLSTRVGILSIRKDSAGLITKGPQEKRQVNAASDREGTRSRKTPDRDH